MVKKKTLADFRREVDAINKATSPQSFGKSPAPFLGQSSSGKKGTGSAMRKGVSSFDVLSSGVKDNTEAQTVSFVNPTPIKPALGPIDDAAVVGKPYEEAKVQPPNFPLATSSIGYPAMEHDPSGLPIEVGGATFRPYGYQGIDPDSIDEAHGFVEGDLSTTENVLSHSNSDDFIDWMPVDGHVPSLDVERDWYDEHLTRPTPNQAQHDVDVSVEKGVSESLVTPDPESLISEGVSDALAVGDVGADAQGQDDFDLMPEVTAGTPFGGLPDAMPAGPMLGGDMGEEAAPAHVPNEEVLEGVDGAATSLSEFGEANTQILEELANSIQALMVRMRNVESQIARF